MHPFEQTGNNCLATNLPKKKKRKKEESERERERRERGIEKTK